MKSIALPLLIAALGAVAALAIAQGGGSPPPLVITGQKPFVLTIHAHDGRKLVVVNMETGKATLSGDPDEAAQVFWDAVGRAGMARCKP